MELGLVVDLEGKPLTLTLAVICLARLALAGKKIPP